jgi:anti-sigma factor RsiW
MDERTVKPTPDPPEEHAELAALADGSLPAERRRALEDQVSASPQLSALLAEQQLASSLLRGLDASAPPRLRAEVNRLTSARTRRRPLALRPRLAAATTAAAAAVAVVLVLALPGGAGGPTVVQAATLADRPAVLPPPGPSAAHRDLLDAAESGVSYPDWNRRFAWRATGARTDVIDGRHATTVFYARGGSQIAYSIVSGRALGGTAHWRSVWHSGLRFSVAQVGGATLVTWQRRGHSCILSGRAVSPSALEALASWHGSSGSLYRA